MEGGRVLWREKGRGRQVGGHEGGAREGGREAGWMSGLAASQAQVR